MSQSPESDDGIVPLSPLALNSPMSMRFEGERRKKSPVSKFKTVLPIQEESAKQQPPKKTSKGPLTPTPIASSAELKKTWPVDSSETGQNFPVGDQDEGQKLGGAPRVQTARRSPAKGKSKTTITIRDTLALLGPLLSAPVEDMLVLLYTKQHATKNAWSEQSAPASTTEESGFFQSWNARVRKMRATLMKGSSQDEIARGLFHLAMRFWDEQCDLDGRLSPHISEAEDIMSTEELLEHLASELAPSRSLSPQVRAALEDVIQIAANSLRTRLDLSLHKSYRWTTNAADLRILYCLSDFPLARSMMMRCKAECGDAPELTDVDKGATDDADLPGVGETGLLADVTQALELSFRGLVDLRTDAEKAEGRPEFASSSDDDNDAMEDVIGFELPVMECLHILSHFAHEDTGGGPPSLLTLRRDANLLSNVAMLTLLPIVFDVFSFAFNPTGYMNTSKKHRFNQFWIHVVECTNSATARAKSGEGKKGAKGDLWRATCCMVPPDSTSPFWAAMVNALGVATKSDHGEVVSALLSLVEAFAGDKSAVPVGWAKAQERAQAADVSPKDRGESSEVVQEVKVKQDGDNDDGDNDDDDDNSELSIELD